MTDTVANITLDKDGTNEMTVYVTNVEEILNKKLSIITPPQSSANWSAGVKTTKIVDLLRIEERFTINGYIDVTDKSKLKSILKAGGVCTMTWDSEDFEVNLDKLTITKTELEDDHRAVMFTCVVGVDI